MLLMMLKASKSAKIVVVMLNKINKVILVFLNYYCSLVKLIDFFFLETQNIISAHVREYIWTDK